MRSNITHHSVLSPRLGHQFGTALRSDAEEKATDVPTSDRRNPASLAISRQGGLVPQRRVGIIPHRAGRKPLEGQEVVSKEATAWQSTRVRAWNFSIRLPELVAIQAQKDRTRECFPVCRRWLISDSLATSKQTEPLMMVLAAAAISEADADETRRVRSFQSSVG